MFGMIGSGNKHINQPAGKVLTPDTATFSVIEGHEKIEKGQMTVKEGTWSEPSEQVNLGNKNNGDMSDIGRLSAFAQTNRKKEDTGSLIEEALMEQTVDPSLLKSDDEAWKKGMEQYLYNTDRTWDDVCPFSKKNEEQPNTEMDAWQKGMAEYRARWD